MDSSTKKSVERELPGWKVENQRKRGVDAELPAEKPDMVGADDRALKAKYSRFLKQPISETRAAVSDAPGEPTAGELEWGRILEKDGRDFGVGAKTVLVDKATGKIKAIQG